MKNLFLAIGILSFFVQCNSPKEFRKVEKWDVFEVEYSGPTDGNPFIKNQLSATFVHNDKRVTVPGFYDGDGSYKIRFSPDAVGEWTYETEKEGKLPFLDCEIHHTLDRKLRINLYHKPTSNSRFIPFDSFAWDVVSRPDEESRTRKVVGPGKGCGR